MQTDNLDIMIIRLRICAAIDEYVAVFFGIIYPFYVRACTKIQRRIVVQKNLIGELVNARLIDINISTSLYRALQRTRVCQTVILHLKTVIRSYFHYFLSCKHTYAIILSYMFGFFKTF